jgi:hypothetical protein
MALLTERGRLLYPLTADPYCCCYGDDDCPNCCAKFVGGEFDVDGNLVYTTAGTGGYELVVVVTMPTPNSRLVCSADRIVFTVTYKLAGVAHALPMPTAAWDRAWQYVGHTPAVSTNDGVLQEGGSIYWGDITDDEWSLTLDWYSCFTDYPVQYGDVSFGVDGASLTIELANCPSVNCCEGTVQCLPCCKYIPTDAGEIINDNWYFYDSASGYTMRVKIVSGIDPETRRACYGRGESTSLEIEIEFVTPPDGNVGTYEPGLCVNFGSWCLEDWTPSETVTETPTSICWTNNTDLFYTVRLRGDCDCMPADILIETTIGVPLSITIPFLECGSDGCRCCCYDCCYDCHFPVSPDACDPLATYEDGGLTQIVGFLSEQSVDTDGDPIYCPTEFDPELGFDVPTAYTHEDSQTGLSRHFIGCGAPCPQTHPSWQCPASGCVFAVVVENNCVPPGTQTLTITYLGGGEWAVSQSGTPYFYSDGGKLYGDCTGASHTGTRVFNGRTFSWTTSFEVTGSSPCDESKKEGFG